MRHDWLATNPVRTLDAWIQELESRQASPTALVGVLDEVCDALRQQGGFVPTEACERWARMGALTQAHFCNWPEPAPAVYGLALDVDEDIGFVVPLQVVRSRCWSIAPPLPENVESLQDLLRGILAAAEAVQPGSASPTAFLEAMACDVAAPMLKANAGEAAELNASMQIRGMSMDVAMLLAALAAVAPAHPKLLRAAVAIVQADGSRLRPVQGEREKLAAFVRERGRGSLLVRAENDLEAAAYDRCFDVVWPVADLRQFAQRLLTAGLLEPFARPVQLSKSAAEQVVARLSSLEAQGRYADLLQLAGRLSEADWSPKVPMSLRCAPMLSVPPSLRHLGRYGDAIEAAVALRDRIRESEHCSHEDLARAELELAASYLDPMRLEEAYSLLQAWVHRIEDDPRMLSGALRVRVWNTAARARSLLGLDGWDVLFQKSLALQAEAEPDSLQRTRNYYAESCLRVDRLDDADALLPEGEEIDTWSARFRAALAHRRGQVWSAPSIERLPVDPGGANHALGLYLMATARQPRSAADAAERFERAASCFRADLCGAAPANVLWVLVHAAEFAAACCRGDTSAAHSAAQALKEIVTQPGLSGLNSRLCNVLPNDGVRGYDLLLERLPW